MSDESAERIGRDINSGTLTSRDIGIDAARSRQPLNLGDTCKLGFCTRRTVSGSEYCEKHQGPFPMNVFDPDTHTPGFERRRTDPDTQERLTRIEAKLDALLSVLDVDLDDEESGRDE